MPPIVINLRGQQKMIATACPACEGQLCEPLERVDVAEQHRDYAPGSPDTQLALDAAASQTALQYQMCKCDRCGLEYADPMRGPGALWYQLAYEALNFYSTDRWEFGEVFLRIPQEEHVFEFGCGSGAFLEHCKRLGRPASGIDFSAREVATCISKGLDVTRVDMNAMDQTSSARFPHMVAFHVLEHVERPAILFANAASRAMKGSRLWLSVPSDQRPARRMGVRDFLDQPPHHMTRWTAGALREIGRRHGWKLAEMIYEPISLRAALWSISYHSQQYRRWKTSGVFRYRAAETAFRIGSAPAALLLRLTKYRALSGFSMLASFSYEKC